MRSPVGADQNVGTICNPFPQRVYKKEGPFNLWRIKCAVFWYDVNNAQGGGAFLVTPSPQFFRPPPSL